MSGTGKPNRARVLFLCTHNSARSQMAEGLLRHFYGERYEANSAGATPTPVHPLAVKAMNEIGIDISHQTSKSIESFRGQDFDVVATVCLNTSDLACPFCSTSPQWEKPKLISETLGNIGVFVEHGFPDPSENKGNGEEQLKAFRQVRDEIKMWVIDYFFYQYE